jgi:AraC-like DNA-binding protein
MRPHLLPITTGSIQSFSIRHFQMPNINNMWHYHPEIELVQIRKGSGTQLVGDSIRHFKEGDIILVGASLPHYWRYDESDCSAAESVVLHFANNAFGPKFFSLPENKIINSVLEKAHRGLQITGSANIKVAQLLDELLRATETTRLILLMKILSEVAHSKETVVLSSIGFKYNCEDSATQRMAAIYDYTLANFKRRIELEEIAAIAGLSPNSFCRYFKLYTGKTYSRFLTEMKIGHACKLLMETRMHINQLCFECGFNNFASFHKHFKSITGKSPLNYQREVLQKSEPQSSDFQNVA